MNPEIYILGLTFVGFVFTQWGFYSSMKSEISYIRAKLEIILKKMDM